MGSIRVKLRVLVPVGLTLAAVAAIPAAGGAATPDTTAAALVTTVTPFTTTLDARSEVPRPTGSVAGARGTFTATLTRTGTAGTLRWRLAFVRLTGPAVAAHIHLAPPGRAGPIVLRLCSPCRSPSAGTARVNARVMNALLNGNAYVNVHTPRNRAGEIRGQVGQLREVTASLDAGGEVPRPTGNVAQATGAFTATLIRTGNRATIQWRLTFARLTGPAVAAHIHLGAPGRAGAIALPLCSPCRSPATGRATIGARLITAIANGNAYVNVHTRTNPPGEIRGQLSAAAAGGPVAVDRTSLGQHLVAGNGMTLYLFEADSRNRSVCTGDCAEAWPPYTTTRRVPIAGAGARQALLGTIMRPDGGRQVTYNGHPLYFFAFDSRPGDTRGQAVDGFGAPWYVVTPQGDALKPPGDGPGPGNGDNGPVYP